MMSDMKVFVDKATGEKYVQFISGQYIALKDLDRSNLEELPADAIKKYTYTSYSYVKERLSLEEHLKSEREWHLKDILMVPVDGKEIPFRVEHVSNDKVYFVAVDIIEKSAMGANNSNASTMNAFLDDFTNKMPYELVQNMAEIEHGFKNKKESRKVSLLSLANLTANCERHTGKDDILFDGLKTEAERCKNYNGGTDWYWLRSPSMSNMINFWYVNSNGHMYDYSAGNTSGVVPCFSLYKYFTAKQLLKKGE